MKAKDIRELAPAEIENRLRETRVALLDLRMRKHTGQLEKPHQLRELRKDIARMETILNEKQTAAA
ncbi:MAG: 50S ribosomal protein L29 [Synoicihabitans sp.]